MQHQAWRTESALTYLLSEQVAREQPEHSREYFMERVRYYREQSLNLPKGSNPWYIEMDEQNAKK
ncbi:TPA: hypothetical protein J1187_000842 [Escherichia coli]|nr:hypothetical protein [Escherichia coli]EGG1062678.1 hypothetical protein [Escherichia coli]EGI6773907.1 hypothetical protein [Escherichia coli]HAH1118343.1 hypothetical protein [Escherichia coli]HAJ7861818.1 hypothetical protein [Escherichia coli]